MITVSEAVGSAGGKLEFTRKNGKKVYIQPLTLKIMSKYEKWLESKAIENCLALKSVDAALFKEAFMATSQEITRGAYSFGGQLCQDSLQTPTGGTKLISLMCNVSEDEAIEMAEQDGVALRDVIDLAISQSVPKSEGDSGNPNPAPTN